MSVQNRFTSFVFVSFLVCGAANAQDSQTIEYSQPSKTITVCGNAQNTNQPGGVSANASGEVVSTATLHWSRQVTRTVYDQDTVEGTGASPLWDEFYDSRATATQRTKILAQAIVGLNSLAPVVYPHFYGQGVKKPRTWNEFSNRIHAAASALEQESCTGAAHAGCIKANSWVPNILNGENGKRNRINLGYAESTIITPRQVTETVSGTADLPMNAKTLVYNISASGLALLPGECEKIGFTFNGANADIGLTADATYNTVNGGKQIQSVGRGIYNANVSYAGAGRKKVGAGRFAGANLSGQTAVVSFSGEVLQYLANTTFANSCSINGTFTVIGSKSKGTCKGDETRTLGQTTVKITQNGQAVSFPTPWTLADKESAVLQSHLSFDANCPFFNSNEF